jgi:hypothetical protein
MSLRDKWDFEFTASKLAEGAMAKKAHHESRQKYWEDANQKVMAKIKESGLEVTHQEISPSGSNVRKFGPKVVVRDDLEEDLTEAHEKIREHANKVREYEGWIQVLNGNPESRLKLNADDYLYFFGTN